MMQKIFKNEKGSISLFVLLSALFFLVVVTSVGVSLKNKETSIDAQFEKTKQSYEKDVGNEEQIYEENFVPRAIFKTGQDVNVFMKQLAGASGATYETNNENIKEIKRSYIIADEYKTDDYVVSTPESNTKIYMWFDNENEKGTINYYVKDEEPSLNIDSSHLFCNLKNLKSIDLSGFDTSNVTNMRDMFVGNSQLTKIDLSCFETSNVENMSGMLALCRNLAEIKFGEHFDTSNVEDMANMFLGDEEEGNKLTRLDLSNFNTSKVKDMQGMFAYCTNLAEIDFGENFDTSNVEDMSNMFLGNKEEGNQLTSLDLSGFNTSKVKNMQGIFAYCTNLAEIIFGEHFDTSKVIDMTNMFATNVEKGNQLTSLDLSGFDTSNVQSMQSMFIYCSKLTTIYVSNDWNTDAVTNSQNMFLGDNKLKGGNGTTYNSNNINKEYARIDGENGLQGYLTAKQ